MRETGKQPSNRESRARDSLYQEVTDRIIAELAQGRVPWVQPWGEAKSGLGLPTNAATSRGYSGINVLILWLAVIEKGFPSQQWLTFRQALDLGGNVRKGERGTTVCYADRFIPKGEAERAQQAGEDPKAIPFLKRFTVFNVAQCDGLPARFVAAPPPVSDSDLVPRAEALIATTKADFRVGGARAFYVPAADYIQVPPQAAFFAPINYYRTCFHELGHWTGHASRLARDLSHVFGSADYAREELVAEMASAFVCASLAIVPTVRHADYIGSWLDLLRTDSRAIFRAASAASKAAEFLLAFQPDTAIPAIGTAA
jgi:antirestriction protein ArdC